MPKFGICKTCKQRDFNPPCGSLEFVPHMETGGNCSNCGHGLPCHVRIEAAENQKGAP